MILLPSVRIGFLNSCLIVLEGSDGSGVSFLSSPAFTPIM